MTKEDATERTILLTGFRDDYSIDNLKTYLRNIGCKPLKCRYEKTFAEVLFKHRKAADYAIKGVGSQTFQGWKLTACFINDFSGQMKKESKLIIRNLAHKCTENQLRNLFNKFGNVQEASIPLKPGTELKRGFGVVKFLKRKDAEDALTKMNNTKLLGRPIAVDWMLPKCQYEFLQKHEIRKSDSENEEENRKSDSESEEEREDENSEMKFYGSDDSETDSDSDEQGKRQHRMQSKTEDKSLQNPSRQVKRDQNKVSDVDQGRTVFIRNIPFNAEEQDLGELMEEHGNIEYARLVVDPMTDQSKGIGFVQFKEKKDADALLELSASEEGVMFDDRRLNVVLAVSKEKSLTYKEKQEEKAPLTSKNLFLARAGFIRPGTQEANNMSEADAAKRQKIEMMKRQKLKKDSIFVSTNRLIMHNIPVKVTDRELVDILLKNSPKLKPRSFSSRIMRDRGKLGPDGKARSLGYSFLQCNSHEVALNVLQAANNSPSIFSDKKRPIVEFSLENRNALELKHKREAAQKAHRNFCPKSTFTTNPDRIVPTRGKKNVSVLPKHFGPKIRKRNRGKDLGKNKSKPKPIKKQRHKRSELKEKNKVKRRKDVQVADNFDRMVAKRRKVHHEV